MTGPDHTASRPTDRTSDPDPLARRYRRLLSLYPAAFRAEREEEMVAVLMHGAEEGRTMPTTREALDLAANCG